MWWEVDLALGKFLLPLASAELFAFSVWTMAKLKKTDILSVGEIAEQLEFSLLLGCKIIQPLWKTFWNFLREWNMYLFYGLAVSFLGYPREIKTHVIRHLYKNIYSSFVHNRQTPENKKMFISWWEGERRAVLPFRGTRVLLSSPERNKPWHTATRAGFRSLVQSERS